MSTGTRKVVCETKCAAVTLKITLTSKFLAKPLVDALLNPFLGAFNKKNKDAAPLAAADLVGVQVDGVTVADVWALVSPLLRPGGASEDAAALAWLERACAPIERGARAPPRAERADELAAASH